VSRDAYRMMKVSTKFEVDTTIRCLERYCCWYVTWPCDLDLWPFNLGQWSCMAGHVANPSTKFEDPTAIRSWVIKVLTSPIGYHWQCVCSHCACAVSRDLCVAANFSHIFEIPDPDLLIHYITFWRYDKDKWSYLAKQLESPCRVLVKRTWFTAKWPLFS